MIMTRLFRIFASENGGKPKWIWITKNDKYEIHRIKNEHHETYIDNAGHGAGRMDGDGAGPGYNIHPQQKLFL